MPRTPLYLPAIIEGLDLIVDMDKFFSLLCASVPEQWRPEYESARALAMDHEVDVRLFPRLGVDFFTNNGVKVGPAHRIICSAKHWL